MRAKVQNEYAASTRLDIRVNSGLLFKSKDGWTLNATDALTEKGKPVKLGKDGKPSEANHGNVTPSIDDKSGGFTIDYAEQTTVLSLAALRRLRFPTKPSEKSKSGSDVAAKAYLAAAAFGLLAATLALDAGYDLRSRCLLRATEPIQWTVLGRPGDKDSSFGLSREQAIDLYEHSLAAAKRCDLPFEKNEVVLSPSDEPVTAC